MEKQAREIITFSPERRPSRCVWPQNKVALPPMSGELCTPLRWFLLVTPPRLVGMARCRRRWVGGGWRLVAGAAIPAFFSFVCLVAALVGRLEELDAVESVDVDETALGGVGMWLVLSGGDGSGGLL